MADLIDLVISAHGGMDQWNSFNHIKAHLKVDGHIWKIKGKTGLLSDGIFEANTHEQLSGYQSLVAPYQKSTWEPGKIILEDADGSEQRTLLNPRKSFEGEVLETQWNDFQPHYFSNYAWWTYFTAPFNFKLPGYQLKELTPWQQDGETLERLEVTFPDYIETHNKVQVFYFDKNYLLRHHDYAPDILQSVPSSQYVWDYKNFMGINIATTRRIYLRNEDASYNPIPVMVSIDVVNVEFSH
ncbi:hypothetical protein [Mucilaginibacter sp.]|uniref:hypothetical protein n=1 Tax=Mucilaginibacter sp. TaxID=1882438 RepID=UPI0025F5C8EA|nr:hypothetical protein [Mucilaginibacter sp.]